MTRLLLDFLNNFPKRLYSNYTFFFFKTNSVFNFSLGLPRNICEFKLKTAKLLNPYKCRNFLKFGLSCLSFLIAALRVTKGFIRFWATSEPQLLPTWLRIKIVYSNIFLGLCYFTIHDRAIYDSCIIVFLCISWKNWCKRKQSNAC